MDSSWIYNGFMMVVGKIAVRVLCWDNFTEMQSSHSTQNVFLLMHFNIVLEHVISDKMSFKIVNVMRCPVGAEFVCTHIQIQERAPLIALGGHPLHLVNTCDSLAIRCTSLSTLLFGEPVALRGTKC